MALKWPARIPQVGETDLFFSLRPEKTFLGLAILDGQVGREGQPFRGFLVGLVPAIAVIRRCSGRRAACVSRLKRVIPRHNQKGILPCFFHGFLRSLLRSMASARATRILVSRGMMMSSI